jgi:hypothetical protein
MEAAARVTWRLSVIGLIMTTMAADVDRDWVLFALALIGTTAALFSENHEEN